jgi:hypothetical protein
LFSLALGGYGLFGVILDVELQAALNERYQPEAEVLSSDIVTPIRICLLS